MKKNGTGFVGRESELNSIMAAWTNQINSEAKKPVILVWLGDSGLGKTRLITEFYSMLVSSQGKNERYWPEDIGNDNEYLAVNPVGEKCDSTKSMPYMWWGIRFEDPTSRNAIVLGSLAGHIDILEPHIAPLRHSRKIKNRYSSLKRGIGKAVVEEAAGAALDFVTAGQGGRILSGLQALGDFIKIKRQELSKNVPINEQKSIQTQSNIDVCLGAFKEILSADGASLPVVLFIDDGQFSNSDPAVAQFLDTLLRQAEKNNWPLFCIVTYWPKEWFEQWDNSVGIAGLLKHLKSESLLPKNWVPQKLSPLGKKLKTQILSDFPGLTARQCNLVYERTGGNPLLYAEIRKWLAARQRYFCDRSTCNKMTDIGLKAIREKEFQLHELVRDRLKHAPPEVQNAVSIGSMQGIRFAASLTTEIAKKLSQNDTESGIQKARRPHAFVEDFEPDIFEFSQRCIHEVASDILLDSFSEKEAFSALLAVIRNKLDNPRLTHQLTHQELELTLRVAVSLYMRMGIIDDGN